MDLWALAAGYGLMWEMARASICRLLRSQSRRRQMNALIVWPGLVEGGGEQLFRSGWNVAMPLSMGD